MLKWFKKTEKPIEVIHNNPYKNLPDFIRKSSYKDKKPLIKVINLTQRFKTLHQTKTIYENISFEIYKDEVVAFLGPNGSGKTTTVSTLCGINKVKEGEIKYLYKYEKTPYEKLSLQFQDLQFPNSLTPRDLIDFAIKLGNIEIKNKEMDEAIEIFGIDKILNTKMSKLSGGQQQRVNVYISMLSKPKILILDEFTTGLDIAIKNRIQNYIQQFCIKNKITLMLVSHDVDTIEQLADRVIILADGKIKLDAPRKEIVKKFGSIQKMLSKYILI